MGDGAAGIEAQGLGKSFGGVRVLAGVDLTVGAGEVVALLGRNGAGKSTTVRILSTLTRPDEGSVRIARASTPSQTPRAHVGTSP